MGFGVVMYFLWLWGVLFEICLLCFWGEWVEFGFLFLGVVCDVGGGLFFCLILGQIFCVVVNCVFVLGCGSGFVVGVFFLISTSLNLFLPKR